MIICIADSHEDDYWFLLYNKDNRLVVIVALEASSTVYDIIASDIRRNMNLTHGVDTREESGSGQF